MSWFSRIGLILTIFFFTEIRRFFSYFLAFITFFELFVGYVLIFQIYFFILSYQSPWGADKLILSEELSNEIFDTFVSCSLFDSKISSYIGYEAAILFYFFNQNGRNKVSSLFFSQMGFTLT